MDIVHPVPWFPAWGIVFSEPIINSDKVISLFNEHRINQRWVLMAYEIAASEVHLWTTWHSLRRREESKSMTSRTVDVEFLRLISGTHQIKSGFKRAGLRIGDQRAWALYLPKNSEAGTFGNMNMDRDSYNKKDDEARMLIEQIGSTILPVRPVPIKEGLERIGLKNLKTELSISDIEDLFLSRMSLSDL
ncbi:MAG: hypothetical protein ACKVI6_06110 [Candidatus Poseidoniales archaeon]|jgi:tRNA threonylcarbamoyladenosine modification (KEOPS) complex Cgi121 subunit|tara:strand:- start:278 stop:847 length:570 start_codon:yes stop_codon:yes gene_type:complete